MTSPRQTLTRVAQELARRGLRPHTGLGQNFLIDLNLQEMLVARAELTPADVVLEVGAGTGGLTARLAALAGRVVAVEIDRGLFELARSTVGAASHVTWICGDVLRKKSALNSEVLAALDTAIAAIPSGSRKLVANLPYQVATPVLMNVLVQGSSWSRLVVTVQKELADRMIAQPATSDYGSLAVMMQALADVEQFRVLPPAVFWPRPNVTSAMVDIRPDEVKRRRVGDVPLFHSFIRNVWLHRRKSLRTVLHLLSGKQIEKTAIDERLADLDLNGEIRPEVLTVEQFIELSRCWHAAAALP